MSSEIVINIQNLAKRYDIYARPIDRLLSTWKKGLKQEFWALRDISFSVSKGETVAIIGQNGSGKSTLLQCLCGTLQATQGHIEMHGKIAALLELGAGFDPESTGRENVYINGLLLGMTRDQITQRFSDIEAFADIGTFIDQPVKTYSSGMYVRLAFAVIAHADPDILIIDEALAVGDVYFVQKCMRFIRKFKENGTILFVSHDTAAVTNLCDRAIWLHNGMMRMQGAAKDVTESYLFFQHAKDRRDQTGEDIQHQTAGIRKANAVIEDDADCRQELIDHSNLRNIIHMVNMADLEAGFGSGKARIIHTEMLHDGQPTRLIHGGEIITLCIDIQAQENLDHAIAGFYFKDRLGQRLFGDNTFLSYIDHPVSVHAQQKVQARFSFRMPFLPVGDYSLDVAFASGTQHDHTQHHWVHDALTFKATASSAATGLIGIPMQSIEMTVS